MHISTDLRRAYRIVRTSALGIVALSCAKEPAGPADAGSVLIVQGSQQQIQGGSELPNPVVVRVLDIEGVPIPGATVGFNVVIGGGSVTPGSALTDENGEAKTKWVTGALDAQQSMQVRVKGVEPVLVSAVALLPSDIIIAQGANQNAAVGAALKNPIVVRIVGPNNTPMKGIAVAFQVTNGGGLISPQSAITNALGEVTTRWTLGVTPGLNSVSVSSGSLQAVTLNAVGS